MRRGAGASQRGDVRGERAGVPPHLPGPLGERLFVAIGTSGRVIDVVPLARECEDSILVNPRRERHVTNFGDHDEYIDEAFTFFLKKKAGEAAEELYGMIRRYLEEEKV